MSTLESALKQPIYSPENLKGLDFETMDAEGKIELIDSVYHLVSEINDFGLSVHKSEAKLVDSSQSERVSRRIGSRFIPMRVKTEAPKTVGETSGASFDEAGRVIRQEVDREKIVTDHFNKLRARLNELLQVPGLRDAFTADSYKGGKLEKIYGKATQAIPELQFHAEELKFQIAEKRREAVAGEQGAAIGLTRIEIEKLETEFDKIQKILKATENPVTLGPMFNRFITLKKYQDSWKNGRIMEVPSVEKIVSTVLENMRAHQPYLLAGHLGAGKTEVARHAAKLFMLENATDYFPNAEEMDPDELYDRLQPEFFSASDEASVYDLVGKLKLTGKNVSDPAVLSVHAKTLAAQLQEHGIQGVPEADITKLLLGQGAVTETIFNYGPLGRALRDGKPLIMDEINMAPPEIISRLNDLLLRRVGDKVRLQENGEESFEIKPGFVIVGTLNVGGQYAGVKEFNAAFRSRWVGQEVGYPELSETYDLILTSLMRKDKQRLPPGFPADMYERLVDLALVVHESQELFTGKTKGQRFMHLAKGMSAEAAQLEKMVISTRDLMKKIIAVWVASDFKKPIEDIIASNILQGGYDAPDDQKFMTELFLRRGFFSGWDAAKFEQAGIRSIDQTEINILQVNKEQIEKDDHLASAAKTAHNRSGAEQRALLRGNSGLVARVLE